jgi:hypothetical protein
MSIGGDLSASKESIKGPLTPLLFLPLSKAFPHSFWVLFDPPIIPGATHHSWGKSSFPPVDTAQRPKASPKLSSVNPLHRTPLKCRCNAEFLLCLLSWWNALTTYLEPGSRQSIDQKAPVPSAVCDVQVQRSEEIRWLA